MLQAAAETAAWQRDGGAGGSGSVAGQQQPQAAAAAQEEDVAQRRERQRVEQLTLACVAAQKERSALQQILESKVWTGVGGGWGGAHMCGLELQRGTLILIQQPTLV